MEAVAERRLEVDEAGDARRLRRAHDVRGADRVRAAVLGPGLGILVGGGRMDDDLGPEVGEHALDELLVGDRVLGQGEVVVRGKRVAA